MWSLIIGVNIGACDEVAASHSMISSARTNSAVGMVRPSNLPESGTNTVTGHLSSVLTHSFDTPETASSSARLPRAFFSRMILALAVHVQGLGWALRGACQ